MKKSIILALVMSGVLMFSSCKKDQEPVTNPSVNQNVSTTQLTDEQVEAKIKDFIAKVKSDDKSTESMSVEDAVWNIEAALNYTFCVNEVDLVMNSEEIIEYNIDNEGTIDFSRIIAIYNELKEKAEELKQKKQYISVIDIDTENAYVSYTIAQKSTNKNTNYLAPISGDWKWHNGDCSGGNASQDALTKIKGAITYALVYEAGTYWTGINPRLLRADDYPNPNDVPTQPDNYRDNLLFKRMTGYTGYTDCIDNATINWYKYKIWDLMHSEIPSGNKPIEFKYYPDVNEYLQWTGLNLWQIKFNYGVQHVSGPKM